MFGIGAGEFIVILIVGLIVFGPGKLPEVGRALGKGLREFRKAQVALSQTLNEADITEKTISKEQRAKSNEQLVKSNEKVSVAQSVTADDVINLAKESPIVKENHNEKISDDIADNAVVDIARASVAGAGGSPNSVGKKP